MLPGTSAVKNRRSAAMTGVGRPEAIAATAPKKALRPIIEPLRRIAPDYSNYPSLGLPVRGIGILEARS